MNDSTRRAVWGVVALGLMAPCTSAATYYVRTSGSNSNSGTSPADAWATVAYAVDNVSAGDIVYVGAGTYTGQVTPSGDGTSASPIQIVADTSGSQTGDAGTVTLRRSDNVIYVNNDDYWTFRGFRVENTSGSAVVENDSSNGFVLEDCDLVGGSFGLYSSSSGQTSFIGGTIDGTDDHAIEVDTGTLVLTGVTIDNVASGKLAIYIKGGANATIDRCLILDGDDGIYIDDADATITNSILHDSGMDDGIYVTGDDSDVVVAHCTFLEMNDGIDTNDGDVHVYNSIFCDLDDDDMDQNGGDIDSWSTIHHNTPSYRTEGFTGTNEIITDPQLTDPANGDYTLQAGSPAIDAGVDASSYTSTDFNGAPRPHGAGWDIGAYEYGSTSYTAANVPYSTDFSSVGDEWVDAIAASDGDVGDFIGPYGDSGGIESNASLYLNTTAGTTYRVTFDLLVIDSWDGDNASYGPDSVLVYVEGVGEFDESFSHTNYPGDQSYPDTPDSTGSWLGSAATDGRYDAVTFTFVAGDAETQIQWIGALSEDISNESWGLIAVSVVEVPPVFVDVSVAAGFNVDTNIGGNDSSGWLWADIDTDGDLDAFVTGGSAFQLRSNPSTGVFAVTGLGSYGRGAAVFDPDGDGDPDFFNANISHMTMFENMGGILIDRGDCGVDGVTNAEGAVAIDTDADGTCEILVPSQGGNFIADNMGAGYSGYNPVGFEDSEDLSDGLNDSGDFGNGDHTSTADVNNDGHLDIFYHYGSGKLFKSDGDGTYTHDNAGISVYTHNSYKFGSAWGDYDNDGDMDLFAPDARSGSAGTLWRNASAGVAFTDVASSAGITATDAMYSATWGDYDNDGDLDLYVATEAGAVNLLYTNNGNGTFTADDLGAALTGGFQDACFVDYDNDGDLDLALTRIDGDGRAVLLQNQTDNDAYLKVRVVGGGAVNTLGIGTRVELLDAGGSTLLAIREIGTARGHGGTEPLWAHFGGVDPATTYTVRIVWPGGETQTLAVEPQSVSTTIGATTVPQMVTVVADIGGARFVRWREVDPTE